MTYLQLKQLVRSRVFPSGEARNLRVAHDKSIVDALIDIQRWAECWQNDNTHLVPQCATAYKCGLTVLNFPRAIIHSVSVVDRLDPETHEESADAEIDWCSEIKYQQVEACQMRAYMGHTSSCGTCWPIHLYFALPQSLCGGKSTIPVPTDAGVPAGLPSLPLGHHYGQVSTDATCRAKTGVWAVDGGSILIGPWIQSTETIVIRWTGIKRDWNDSDLIDDDPTLIRAVESFLRWEHNRDWERNIGLATTYSGDYKMALADLIYDCNEETKVRECEAVKARGIAPITKLFFNDRQQATASCPGNQTGDSVTVVIAKDTVASNVSVADANQLAVEQARTQAQAQLICTDSGTVYWNSPQSYTAECPDGSTGNASTATIEASKYSSTVSQADANAQALAAAQALAEASRECTYSNSEQSYTAECPDGEAGDSVTKTTAAGTYTSTVSRADANQKAYNAAKVAAEGELVCDGEPAAYLNTQKSVQINRQCYSVSNGQMCSFTVVFTVTAGRFTSMISVAEANAQALSAAQVYGNQLADLTCVQVSAGHAPCHTVVTGSL